MQINITEVIGLAAGIATTVSFVPQVYRVYKTRKTEDLSLGMYIIFCCGLSLWIVFGIMLESLSVIMANVVTLVLALFILVMKLRHG